MKILIDTNILISAALNNQGTPYKAYIKAVTSPNQAVITDQNIDELKRIFNRKFPNKIYLLDEFLSRIMSCVEIIETPITDIPEETKIRDVKDRPILRAAMANDIDILITGDKDFLESGITNPKIMTASEFIAFDNGRA